MPEKATHCMAPWRGGPSSAPMKGNNQMEKRDQLDGASCGAGHFPSTCYR